MLFTNFTLPNFHFQSFFNTDDIFRSPVDPNISGVDSLLAGMTVNPEERTDAFVVETLRNRLFNGGSGPGLDLIAFNINRGRDHGIPGKCDVCDAHIR